MTFEPLPKADCAFPELDVSHRTWSTILFTDLEDSTGLAATLDAPAYAELVLEHVRIVAQVVQAHAGAIHQFTGDGALALWAGQPDGPARGLATALTLFQRVTLANSARRQSGRPWRRVRIGLHLGETIIASASNELQGLAIGPDVNFARRVEQAGRYRRTARGDAVITASGCVLSTIGLAAGSDPYALYDLRPQPFGDVTLQSLDEPAPASYRRRDDTSTRHNAERSTRANSPADAEIGQCVAQG